MMRILTSLALSLALVATTAHAGTYNITVDKVEIDTGDFKKQGIGYNGASPGPVLQFEEGEDVTINVTNNLDVSTSIHWHGLILPFQQDGVPTISFDGIEPGETFTYQFPIIQSGTYWFHSHSGFQEPDGAYGSIVIKPKKRDPFRYNREYVIQLTDSHPHDGDRIMRNLKTMPDYYNRQQQTFGDFLDDIAKDGFEATVADRMAWGEMRMMAADIEDLQGFTPLMNGKGPKQNWTGLFKPGERIRLRFINSSAMTYFDIRIPGLKMLVVNADGNNVQPVKVDEFRIAVAETYDVIVRPKEARAFTIFAASMGRSAYGRGTLAPRMEMAADTPALDPRPLLTMADMGMAHEGMDHGSMNHGKMNHGTMKHGSKKPMDHGKMAGPKKMDHSKMGHGKAGKMDHSKMGHGKMAKMDHGKMDHSKMGHGSMKGMDHSKMGVKKSDPFYADGSGLMPDAGEGKKFLSYKDLKAHRPIYKHRKATREIELRLTGNMERYIWSINGKKYQDDEEIRLKYGERVRFKFVNETMMSHPMHLHGMWTIIDVGAGKWNPAKHVVSVAPGTTVYTETEVDAPGQWAFHCHLSYHARSGMFRKIVVEGGPKTADASNSATSSALTQ